ncbi:sensor domain-containing diguanylate cyclase [Halothiobacillus sp.]|uniref:sensor domain-containing diguanylate cyclase n=1 Tax=Halothiobacillus sp. TaxID=1891311 RepID=UPI002AD41D31|nr:sensor domain-containing diguanylate cyclase [Halothiobacillus sp.]
MTNSSLLATNSNLLDARPSTVETRTSRSITILLFLCCVVVAPFSQIQWPVSNVIFSMAGISAFAQITTGVLLLTQAMILRNDAVFALSLGYLAGGLVVTFNILLVHDIDTQLWVFRIWHAIFVVSILAYTLLSFKLEAPFARKHFLTRVRYGIGIITGVLALLAFYLIDHPFDLPPIIFKTDYTTAPSLWANGIQLLLLSVAWVILVKNPRKTVLTIWTTVVASAVLVDIILFVLGGKLFTVGLYISKLNNLVAVTLIFGVIFYHYVRIQREMLRNRVWLLRANRRLNRRALSDSLTNLPNRAALETYLEFTLTRAQRNQSRLAVCVIDLDEFKPVNDRYGHETGDLLLHALSKRLSGVLRQDEFLARLGGDEFVLIIEGFQEISTLNIIMARISNEIAQPFTLDNDITVQVHASIGIALYPEISKADELMRMADRALYRAKNEKASRTQSWRLHLVEPQTS